MTYQQGLPQTGSPFSKKEKIRSVGSLYSYKELLSTFLEQDYEFVLFQEITKKNRQLVLRHDIDFDTNFALQMAEIEAEIGIKSTYFFLLRSNFYNVLALQDFENVQKIKALGHSISIHFDPVIYKNFRKGLEQELSIFQHYFETDVKIISLHRPNDFFLKFDEPINNIEHTYQSKYFKDIKYISDSTGIWRYGHPLDTEAFSLKKSIHLLIHPVWWMVEGPSNFDKLRAYFAQRTENLKQDFFNNCKPFREISENL